MIKIFLPVLAVIIVLIGLNSCCCSEEQGKRAQADFYIGAGEQSLKQGDYEDAKQSFKKAIELQPAYPSGYYFKGKAFKALGNDEMANENFEKAIMLYKEFLKKESSDMYYNELADLYETLGKHKEAIEALDKVIIINPSQRKKVEQKIDELKAKIENLKDNVNRSTSKI